LIGAYFIGQCGAAFKLLMILAEFCNNPLCAALMIISADCSYNKVLQLFSSDLALSPLLTSSGNTMSGGSKLARKNAGDQSKDGHVQSLSGKF
jgi:hypothetical protein